MRPFSLAGAPHLPVTGDMHPLRKEHVRWLSSANIVTLAIGLAVFAAWFVWSHRANTDEVPVGVKIVNFVTMGVPPSITQPSAPQVAVAEPVAPTIGVPEPVPDEQAQSSTIATQSQLSDALAPITASDLGTPGDSIVVTGDTSPNLGDFVAFDELPVLLSMDPVVYPDLAKQAGIDGRVLVQVLVGKDGKVKKAVAIQGPEVLMAAAVTATRTARFKPALQGTSPVEVWVQVPVEFSLASGL